MLGILAKFGRGESASGKSKLFIAHIPVSLDRINNPALSHCNYREIPAPKLLRRRSSIQKVVRIQDSVGISLLGQEPLAMGCKLSIDSVARDDCVEVS